MHDGNLGGMVILVGVVIQLEWSSRWSGCPDGIVIQVEYLSSWSGHPGGRGHSGGMVI